MYLFSQHVFPRFHEIFDNLSKHGFFKEELMNVMTMEVTPQRRNKHEINTQIKENQSQTATGAQNRQPKKGGGRRRVRWPCFLGVLFCASVAVWLCFSLICVFISCLLRMQWSDFHCHYIH